MLGVFVLCDPKPVERDRERGRHGDCPSQSETHSSKTCAWVPGLGVSGLRVGLPCTGEAAKFSEEARDDQVTRVIGVELETPILFVISYYYKP